MYGKLDSKRIVEEQSKLEVEPYRSEYRRDYARLMHSPSFRRLQGKTQLYPGKESDFFRNRLSHSLEVAQIGKSITLRLNHLLKDSKYHIDPDIVEFAGLAHDLGHPPFGHQGEEALDNCMMKFGGFEGNAQTLRILSKIEKKIYNEKNPLSISKNGRDERSGLNLTYRTLASILKYDNIIPKTEKKRIDYAKNKGGEVKPVKGFYHSELEVVEEIKKHVAPKFTGEFKTIECRIMDLADDIAYSTYDLEDGMKAGFYNPFDIVFAPENIIESVRLKISEIFNKRFTCDNIREILKNIFISVFKIDSADYEIDRDTLNDFTIYSMGKAYNTAKLLSNDGYIRTTFTSALIGKYIRGVEIEINDDFPCMSKVKLNDEIKLDVEVLKKFTYESQIQSPRLKISEFRGKQIVKEIFECLSDIDNKGFQLLPIDYQLLYSYVPDNYKKRIICDFIAGMTDDYCIEFYGRLVSENPETIFKPF